LALHVSVRNKDCGCISVSRG